MKKKRLEKNLEEILIEKLRTGEITMAELDVLIQHSSERAAVYAARGELKPMLKFIDVALKGAKKRYEKRKGI